MSEKKDQQGAGVQQEQDGGPHMEVLDRVKNLPSVQSAIEKTCSTYSYVKDSHHLINWALNYAEAGINYATATAAPLAAPLAKKFEGSISSVDQKLCQGLDIVESKVPIVKEPPAQVCQTFTFRYSHLILSVFTYLCNHQQLKLNCTH